MKIQQSIDSLSFEFIQLGNNIEVIVTKPDDKGAEEISIEMIKYEKLFQKQEKKQHNGNIVIGLLFFLLMCVIFFLIFFFYY